MTAPERWLLTAGALAPLAIEAGVPLPAAWNAPSRQLDRDLLARLGPLEEPALLAERLAPWAARSLVATLTVSPTAQVPVASDEPAACFQAHLTLAGDRLVSLVRRDGVGLVELSCAPAEQLPDELERLLRQVQGGAAPGAPVRLDRERFEMLSRAPQSDGLLGSVRHIAQTTVTGPVGVTTGALWYDAGGWWRVRPAGGQVLFEPARPRVSDWAPLLDQVLA